ncbi:MAG: glutaredoxin family protein [Moraxellaceae bacterium]|jgi:hypothetical protein|nr:glutaredoxin family protein [Moraxellaceae bacterium]
MAGGVCMDEGRALVLLGTSGCHLCDRAEALLAQAASARAFTWRYHDIALEDALVSQYGERIPVLLLPDGRELNWPFSLLDILSVTG